MIDFLLLLSDSLCKPQSTNENTTNETQKFHTGRLIYKYISMFIILSLLLLIPTVYHWNSFDKFDSLINKTILSITQCEHTSILLIDNRIFVFISLILCVSFSYLIERKEIFCNGQSGSMICSHSINK